MVLFLGGEKGAREREAEHLLGAGFADYLIIPATSQIMKQGPDGKLEAFSLKPRPQDEKLNTSDLKLKTASWLENTHIELLGAKRLMENLGLRSALFVSSAYHIAANNWLVGVASIKLP